MSTIRFQEHQPAIASFRRSSSDERAVTVIGTTAIRDTLDPICLEQALVSRCAPGVEALVLNPDAHPGYGAPVGSVLVSPTHLYPGPVGVDIKCSMSLLQLDLPADELLSAREVVLRALAARTPTGPVRGQRVAPKGRRIPTTVAKRAVIEGASPQVCEAFGIPPEWADACEDAAHLGHDNTTDTLAERLALHEQIGTLTKLDEILEQLGSYGGGNHFGEANRVSIRDTTIAGHFGLQQDCVAFLSHCGSRGFGYQLAQHQFRSLQRVFEQHRWALPGGDPHLVYAPLGTRYANEYLDDMALAANFATVNHLLLNALVLEAFQEVFPGVRGNLVYFISHNIARLEELDGIPYWVHRKGATRAFPAGHSSLTGSRYHQSGHPILLPGNPLSGSAVMVAKPGAARSWYSVNHGAGRAMGRRRAIRSLNQRDVDAALAQAGVLSNCARYPLDEAPAAYKDFAEVLRSVEQAGLASPVAHLQALLGLKDNERTR